MNELHILKRLIPDVRVVVYECRRCGTNVDDSDVQCPNCDSSSVARYEIK